MTYMDECWISTSEAMQLLGVSRPTVLKLVHSGKLSNRRRGMRSYEVMRSEVLARLEPVRAQ